MSWQDRSYNREDDYLFGSGAAVIGDIGPSTPFIASDAAIGSSSVASAFGGDLTFAVTPGGFRVALRLPLPEETT